MQKLVWVDRDQVKEQAIPTSGFLTLGRGGDNHIVLKDPSVSRHHARLVSGPHGCLLKGVQDVGTVQVNGAPIRSCFLQHGDVIQIGGHFLEFRTEEAVEGASGSMTTGPVAVTQSPESSRQEALAREEWASPRRRAFLRYVSGPDSGRIQKVDRPLVTLGEPEGYYVAISRRSNGFYVLNLGRGLYASLNDDPIRGGGILLRNGDLITVGGWQVEVRIFEATEH